MPIPSLLLASLALPVAAQAPATQGVSPGVPMAQAIDVRSFLEEEPPQVRCRDFRLNSFTKSSQDNVSLGAASDGSLVVAWHSRRQEEGTYGIRARRMDEDGEFLSEEVTVNETSKGMQIEPSVSLDPSGAAWFTWVSRGQDGSGDGVYARRFSGKLDAASAEVRVDDVFEGDQSEPSIVALADGRALCAWTGPAQGNGAEVVRGQRALFARILAPNGRPEGDKFELQVAGGLGVRTPATAVVDGVVIVAASTYDSAGRPAGIFLFEVVPGHVTAEGVHGQPRVGGIRVDGGQHGALPVEPSLSSTEGRAAIAWLEANQNDASGEYGIRWRSLSLRDASKSAKSTPKSASLKRIEPGTIHEVEAPERGYTSGLAIAIRGADTALIWSRYLAGENGTPRLYCQVVREESSQQGDAVASLLETRHATETEDGKQAMAVGGAGQRAQFTASGRLAAVWHGDADLGDSSGAHLTLLTLQEETGVPRIVADAAVEPHRGTASLPASFVPPRSNTRSNSRAKIRADNTMRAGDASPAPHDVPTFDPKDIDPYDVHDVIQRSSSFGTNLDFRGFSSTGWTPPGPRLTIAWTSRRSSAPTSTR
ncbi:MAG: hypothetical protein ACJAQ3_000641 [Planctomycetota bacterium]|jgi:hypothetical protein